MQKCLHSRRYVFGKRIFLIIALLFLFCVMLQRSGNKPKSQKGKTYLYLAEETGEDIKKSHFSANIKNENDNKMNNQNENNSKNNMSNKKIVSPILNGSIITAVDKNGKTFKTELEDYVLGCLIGEMPINFHSHALMAQSVAIRSFTVNKILYGSKHDNGVVCTNPSCCQNYISPEKSGLSNELLEKAKQAVNATKGVVAVYDGMVINAVYHAGSAERTKDSLRVWGSSVAYLKSVESPPEEAEICAEKYNGSLGHGVGMSQQGANILAGYGYGYDEIIKYYYSSVGLEVLKFKN